MRFRVNEPADFLLRAINASSVKLLSVFCTILGDYLIGHFASKNN